MAGMRCRARQHAGRRKCNVAVCTAPGPVFCCQDRLEKYNAFKQTYVRVRPGVLTEFRNSEESMTRRKAPFRAIAFSLALAAFAVCSGGAQPAYAQQDVNATIEQFDEVRALAMRALLRAQELKTACLYGRGFGLRMPEYVAEDVLVEGLWLFDYLNSMDTTSMSLICYATAAEHPNLERELALFRAYLSEAAHKTSQYYDKVAAALDEAVRRVNAAGNKKARFFVDTIPAQPWTGDAAIQASAGDGFNLGWSWPVVHGELTRLGRYLKQHGYAQDRILTLAKEAGIDFIRPADPNLFDWVDVEIEQGKYLWDRIDKMLALLKKHELALWLPVPSSNTSPPQWLRERLGNEAVLMGSDGKPLAVRTGYSSRTTGIGDFRQYNNPPNLFNPDVSAAFARYIRQLVTHVKESGVRIAAVQLDNAGGLNQSYGSAVDERWRAWLKKNNVDPLERWNMAIDKTEAILPIKAGTLGLTDVGRKRMFSDIRRWREDECVDYFRLQAAAIRSAAPDVPICTGSSESGGFNESTNGRPDERLVRELKLLPFGGGNGPSVWDDLRRSYSPVPWSASLAGDGWWVSSAQYSFSSYVHGSFTIISAPVPVLRGFYRGDAFLYPDLRWRWSSLRGWRRYHERAQSMAPEMLNTKPLPLAAVLWSDTSNRYQSFIRDRVHLHSNVAAGHI